MKDVKELMKEEKELLKKLEEVRTDIMLKSIPKEVTDILNGFNATFSRVEKRLSSVRVGELAYIPDVRETELLLMCDNEDVCNLIQYSMCDEYDYEDYEVYSNIFVFKKQ